MAQNTIEKILGSEVLSEDVKTSISEAWNARLAEARDDITAELREEFASRYENDKAQIVEAMDAMLSDVISAELTEFAQDKNKLAEDRVGYKKAIKEHAKVLDKFITQTLHKEITELREDRKSQKGNFVKLEEFVLGQLSKELNEFHDDKRSLVEQKVKLAKEGKKAIAEAKQSFIKNAAKKVEKIIESTIKGELTTLKEDIQTAKENNFGRKIFETFAAEFLTSTLSEGTQVSRMSRKIAEVTAKLDEAQVKLTTKDKQIMEAKRQARVISDKSSRNAIISEMLSPLGKEQRGIMNDLLESVKTENLRRAFDKYLPSVLRESGEVKVPQNKARLTESSRTVSGDRASKSQSQTEGSADIINLRKLAGIG